LRCKFYLNVISWVIIVLFEAVNYNLISFLCVFIFSFAAKCKEAKHSIKTYNEHVVNSTHDMLKDLDRNFAKLIMWGLVGLLCVLIFLYLTMLKLFFFASAAPGLNFVVPIFFGFALSHVAGEVLIPFTLIVRRMWVYRK